ncbi:hypothetical protein lerEdw1_012928 [Lerista edwardsae]|nr:hypothetical protein lerEdw1_012928 [Lerista edwardsae]
MRFWAIAMNGQMCNACNRSSQSLHRSWQVVAGSCGPPMWLNFAELVNEDKEKNFFPVGTTVKYLCRPGYAKHPGLNASATCLGNHKWSEAQEFCKRRSCGYPGEPENGQLIVPEDFLLGSTVNYICNEGHKQIGQSSRRCVVSGRRLTWTGEVPLCQPISCSAPPDVRHGKHTGMHINDFFYAMSVTYTCEEGYPLVGNASIHCTTKDGINGVWSGRVYCGAIQCFAPQMPANGKHSREDSEVFTSGVFVKYSCKPGYNLIGETTIYCTESGTWNATAPKCEAVQCQAPPYIQNGTHNNMEATLFTSGMSVKYTCDPGSVLLGEATIYCTASGTWSSPSPHCKVGSCGRPVRLNFAELANEDKEKDSFPIGTTMNYFCRPGYAKDPGLRASVTCLMNQKWDEAQEFCKRKSCGNPGEPENGRLIVPDDIYFGSTVHYICDEGHKQIGQASRQCVVSGRRVVWTGEVPSCQRISCSPPPDIPHGTHTGRYREDFSYATSVTYTCEEGYPLIGNASVHCTTKDGINGVWNGHVYCGGVNFTWFFLAECPRPIVENGRMVAGHSNTFNPNHGVTFDCSAGHVMVGSREIYCQVDGTWEPPPPHCEPGKY